MAVRLTMDLTPRPVDFERGVRVTMRPATAIEHGFVERTVQQRLAGIRDDAELLAKYECPELGAQIHRPAMLMGLAQWMSAVDLAAIVVTEWEGVEAGEGVAAPLNERNLIAFLRDPEMLETFQLHAFARLHQASAEGNAFGGSLRGGSAGEPPIADAAATPDFPAAAASGAKTANTALN